MVFVVVEDGDSAGCVTCSVVEEQGQQRGPGCCEHEEAGTSCNQGLVSERDYDGYSSVYSEGEECQHTRVD